MRFEETNNKEFKNDTYNRKGAARVGEQRERSLPEIGKIYRKDNKIIERCWKCISVPHPKSKW